MGDEKPANERSKDFITWDDLATQILSKPVNDDLSQLPLREAKMWPMRWAIIIIATVLLVLIIAYSIILFLLTKNLLALLTPTGLTASIFVIVRYAGRFLFWKENDYRLAEKKLELKAKELETKHSGKIRYKANK